MKKFAVVAVCLAFAGPAFAQSITEKTGVNSVLGIAPSTADFVSEAAISDMFEIASSQLAAEKSDAPTQAFAKEMIADHEKTAASLKAFAVSGAVKETIPTDLDTAHQDMLEKLKGLSGSDFTTQYHSDQVSAHKDAVSLFERYAKSGDNPKLKDWAGKTLPTLQHHLEMAQNLNEKRRENEVASHAK